MGTNQLTTDVLSRADELEASGRILEAIDLLAAMDTDLRGSDTDVRLVELRMRAFDAVGPTSGLASWPHRNPDPFPDVVGEPPVIGRDELDPQVLAAAIEHHGSLLVRGLVGPADADRLRQAVNNAFKARAESAGDGGDPSWYTPFEEGSAHKVFPAKRYVRIIDSPRSLAELIDVYRENGIVDIVTGHLGERPALSAHKCALRRLTAEPGEKSTDYHQDGSFLGAGIRTVNIWLALTGCGGDADAPGLDLLPRRIDRILDTGVDGAHLDWTISEAVVARAAEGMPIVRPVFEPGDALLFDELMVHRTGFSEGMTRERIAIEAWFFAPSVYPDDHVPLLV